MVKNNITNKSYKQITPINYGDTMKNIYQRLSTRFYKIAKEKINQKIEDEITELKKYKFAYQHKIKNDLNAYKNINNMIKIEFNNYNICNENIINHIKKCNKQIKIIKKQILFLKDLRNEKDVNKSLNSVIISNRVLKSITESFINNSINYEKTILNYLKDQKLDNNSNKVIEEKISNNSTLLISEIQNKVILPYTGQEVKDVLDNKDNEYQTEQEVVDNLFTRPLSDFDNACSARFREAYRLVTERENYSKIDGIRLGIELFGKRYLHPAIIAACRTVDELDVYLDCLSKNELNDFKIFDIKYELHPMVVKQIRGKQRN